MARGYTKRLSLGLQFEHDFAFKIKNIAHDKVFSIMKKTANDLVESFKKNKKFFSVTGNTFTSFYASVYYKGKMQYMARSVKGEENPTRKTLKEGEAYDLDYYYDGPVEGDPYVGDKGKGGQWGPNLVYGRLGKFDRPSGDWAIMCVCPVEYAKYNKRIFETVYNTYEMLPDLFSVNVMYVSKSIFNNDL